ncbi:DUF1353 domain-containing protein [Pseudoalteromonas sp. CO302Y]|uniref:DUF1353 domain-containing protein n=1 Tax=unclassified Pseudoalteromonas TaxID=194690 RepID=UPI0010239E56|nr:DUF1353 domain-containing protein [Pseudoalteromonas sp. CO302Y]RZG11125.1 DUF1353 domain-containing protein [Pseudoalteromonas sp. CO133X]
MQIKLNFFSDGKAQLLEPLNTQFGEVHRFFVTDGFTLPWFVRWFHNPFGDGLLAAIWHDFALKTGRKKAHYEFFILLKDSGVPIWKAYIMWFFVSLYAMAKRLFA